MTPGFYHAGDTTGLINLDNIFLGRYSPAQILRYVFSTKSYVLATSSAAVKIQKAHGEDQLKTFKQIGKGQCGEIWAMLGTRKILKVANVGKVDELYNDCCMHKRIEEAFEQTVLALRKDINIPLFGNWIHSSNTQFWVDFGMFFPRGFQPTYGLLSERIHPLPLPVREALFDTFAPRAVKGEKAAFLARAENEDCLVRLYLGRRAQRTYSNGFRLRNFDLAVNEMEYFRLDTTMYAKVMAQTLAILHWKARVDANDVEFVLGSAPKVGKAATAVEFDAMNADDARFIGQTFNFGHGAAGIWLLDFNQCRSFSDDPAGLKQLERGFFFNDPYYPRPGRTDPKDKALWELFKQTYLQTSSELVVSDMPQRFIQAVEIEGAKRMSGGSIFQ